MMTNDYESMTTEELEALNTELSNRREEIRQEQLRIWAVLNVCYAERQEQLMAEIMADPERRAKLQGI